MASKQQALDYLTDEQHDLVAEIERAVDDYRAAAENSAQESEKALELAKLGERIGRVHAAILAVKEGR